jgi:hypothetical protein
MSQENVEVVRRYYGVLDSALERYWAAPDTRDRLVGRVREALRHSPLVRPTRAVRDRVRRKAASRAPGVGQGPVLPDPVQVGTQVQVANHLAGLRLAVSAIVLTESIWIRTSIWTLRTSESQLSFRSAKPLPWRGAERTPVGYYLQ